MLQAFFVGRALAAAVSERAGHVVSDGLSQLGKFDAEQREKLREFTEEVMARAEQEKVAAEENGGYTSDASVAAPTPPGGAPDNEDLQATIDDLRAEIAQARAAIQQHKQAS